MKLTMARIEGLKCPAGKHDMLVFDEDQRGLGVRVTKRGGKNFVAQYVFGGQTRRTPLGSCNAISLAVARNIARTIAGDVARGLDPWAERQKARGKARVATDALSLSGLIDNWQALHLASLRPRYAVEATRALRQAFRNSLDAPAADLSRAKIVKTLDAMTKKGRATMAARTAAYGKAAFSWARGAVETNPFINVPVTPTVRRERVLSDDELASIWRAVEAPSPFSGIVRLLILTGQRREEVAGMKWAELANDLSTWTIPGERAKNGKAHVVPLTQPVQALLRGLPRLSDLVFGRFNNWTRAKAALDRKSGVAVWRLHDLRRTCATGLQRLGVRLEVTEKVLNHVSGSHSGIVGIYQRYNFATEKRHALDAWGMHVMNVVEGGITDNNIVVLRA